MNILFNENSKQFHLYNEKFSYIMKILEDGELVNLYFGSKIDDNEDFSYTILTQSRAMAIYSPENNHKYNFTTLNREFPDYGTGDYRYSAFEIEQENGSRITCFKYLSHKIFAGKKPLENLPATYTENDDEAMTLEVTLQDELINTQIILSYTIFKDFSALAKSVKFVNNSEEDLFLNKALSMNIDLPDSDFDMMNLSGAWSRERQINEGKIRHGYQGISSTQGTSSSEQNPFISLRRPNCTETSGEVYGFSLVYSGNHIEQVEVTPHGLARVSVGINPLFFKWHLCAGESFQTPEAIVVYSEDGLNGMSQTFHKLFRTRLARGPWRDKERPILLNNWESTGMNFTEQQIVDMAILGKDLGVELFVLDDGWFGGRDDDKRGLGDWYVTDFNKLPSGIDGLAKKITDLGIEFGLWFEPEMANPDSDLYRNHPEFIIQAPNRKMSLGRNQLVIDFSNPKVVDYIYDMMYKILSTSNISYVKWDMNRYISECYSLNLPADKQGEVFHRFVLGVYDLYERLITAFPEILFESCSSGGCRFDAGMLYYAPQAWTSDDTDAVERLKIQYGTSMLYPVSSMGAHVSATPNHLTKREVSFKTRGDVAMFGAFGYELDVTKLTDEEKAMVKEQIAFLKENRKLLHQGDFYRLVNPFKNKDCAWAVVSEDKKEAIVAHYQILMDANSLNKFLKVEGLDESQKYTINSGEKLYSGKELAKIGIPLTFNDTCTSDTDFTSHVFHIKAEF